MTTDVIPIFIMGKRYEVLPGLTIMKALEYAGYRLVRGVGCRGGFCGACATVYRIAGDDRLYFGLACQTVIQPNMYLAQVPFFPARAASYQLDALLPVGGQLWQIYPEVLKCLGCGTCTKACPQEIDVRAYMAAAMRGDLAATASISFDCIMCGLCAARCPAGEAQYNVGILSRRLYGKYLAPRSDHLAERLDELAAGAWGGPVAALKAMSTAELKECYKARDIEK